MQEVGWQAVVGEWLDRVADDSLRLYLADLIHAYFPKGLLFPDTPLVQSTDSAHHVPASPSGLSHGRAEVDISSVSNDAVGEMEWRSQDTGAVFGIAAVTRVVSALRILENVLRCDGYEIMRDAVPPGSGASATSGSPSRPSSPADVDNPRGSSRRVTAVAAVPEEQLFGVVRRDELTPLSAAQKLHLSRYFVFATVWGMGGHLSVAGVCVCVCARASCLVCVSAGVAVMWQSSSTELSLVVTILGPIVTIPSYVLMLLMIQGESASTRASRRRSRARRFLRTTLCLTSHRVPGTSPRCCPRQTSPKHCQRSRRCRLAVTPPLLPPLLVWHRGRRLHRRHEAALHVRRARLSHLSLCPAAAARAVVVVVTLYGLPFTNCVRWTPRVFLCCLRSAVVRHVLCGVVRRATPLRHWHGRAVARRQGG